MYRMYFQLWRIVEKADASFDYDSNGYTIDIVFMDGIMQVITDDVLSILEPYLFEENYDLERYEYKIESNTREEVERIFNYLINEIKKLKED